jgi:hypothetical protein
MILFLGTETILMSLYSGILPPLSHPTGPWESVHQQVISLALSAPIETGLDLHLPTNIGAKCTKIRFESPKTNTTGEDGPSTQQVRRNTLRHL